MQPMLRIDIRDFIGQNMSNIVQSDHLNLTVSTFKISDILHRTKFTHLVTKLVRYILIAK